MKPVLILCLLAAVAHAEPVPDAPDVAPFVLPAAHKLILELELFVTGAWTRRDGPDLNELRLDRGEFGATVGIAHGWNAEVRLESIRSAADGGELGIDGDSLVIRVKRAQLLGDAQLGDFHVTGAAGVVNDPWITALEQDYTLRPFAPTASEQLLDWNVSDLAFAGRVVYGPARLTVNVGNGEGLDYPERNSGKTTTAVLEVVPIATTWRDQPLRLRLAAVGRDGSIGPALARDHRVGGAATLTSAPIAAGAEVVRAWGLDERGDLVSLAAAGWLELRPERHLAIAARAATIGFTGAGRASRAGGAIAVQPWTDGARGRIRIWLAVEHTWSSGGGEPLAGADPGDATTASVIFSTTAPVSFE